MSGRDVTAAVTRVSGRDIAAAVTIEYDCVLVLVFLLWKAAAMTRGKE